MHDIFTLQVAERRIAGIVHLPTEAATPPYIITCHGLFSSKESAKFTSIAEYYTKRGLAVVRFDFSGCGESSGDIADTTVTRRFEELEHVAAYAAQHPRLGEKYAILGSSLGGYLALLYAGTYRVQALSIWATPFVLPEIEPNIPREDLARLKETFFRDARSYDLESILGTIHTVQILHGMYDEVVPWKHAEMIHERVNDPKNLELFSEGDHSLTGGTDRRRAIEASCAWCMQHLSSK